jgi:hypothetical protein
MAYHPSRMSLLSVIAIHGGFIPCAGLLAMVLGLCVTLRPLSFLSYIIETFQIAAMQAAEKGRKGQRKGPRPVRPHSEPLVRRMVDFTPGPPPHL